MDKNERIKDYLNRGLSTVSAATTATPTTASARSAAAATAVVRNRMAWMVIVAIRAVVPMVIPPTPVIVLIAEPDAKIEPRSIPFILRSVVRILIIILVVVVALHQLVVGWSHIRGLALNRLYIGCAQVLNQEKKGREDCDQAGEYRFHQAGEYRFHGLPLKNPLLAQRGYFFHRDICGGCYLEN